MVIFSDKDMSVSLDVVKKKIKDINNRHMDEIKEIADVHATFVNDTKKMFSPKGTATIFDDWIHEIGKPTGYFLNGIELYTGDEIELRGNKNKQGRLFIVAYYDGELSIISNYEIGKVRPELDIHMKISRHMHTYKDGDEVAKGRKGCAGFIIKLEGAK
ncbi:hypothetical protein [Bacillus phage vB_BanS-Thrax3]|nr:hypothetical protein [Bacillus phage vB_BanS-Thrax3]